MQDWIVLLEFCTTEGIEVVTIEIGLGSFCEILHLVTQAVMENLFAVVKKHLFIDTGTLIGRCDWSKICTNG